MAIDIGGISVSYECGDLISEVKEEIELYGADHRCYMITSERKGVRFVTDYALDITELQKFNLSPGEVAGETTLNALLEILEKQDSIY